MTARPTEQQCQDTIIEAAQYAGWLVHAERPARTATGWRTAIQGTAGWPDLILVRGNRVIVAELKRKPNKLSNDQAFWLDALTDAGIDARTVWVPEGMDAFIEELMTTDTTNPKTTP